jgi:UDP:flavonoid glycosyltransferase YjiC (YdhE family)
MADLLVVTWAGGGNVNPLLALCAALAGAGHGVRALAPASLAPRFGEIGVPVRETGGPVAPLDQQAADVTDALRTEPCAAAIVDYMLPAGLCAAEAAGVATVAFVHTRYTGVADGPFSPMTMAADVDTLNALRQQLGLPPVDAVTDLLGRADLALLTTTAALDGGDPLPATVVAVGPLVDPAVTAWSPRRPPDEVPLVVASLGTTPMNEGPVIERVLEALADLDVQGLVTVGDHLDRATFTPPPNTDIAGYVPHAAVLPHARLLINHAGLSGIGAALASGVPMVCVPLGRDQPGNAARVEAIGAGVRVPPDAPAAELRSAIRRVLDDDRYAAVAEEQRRAIADASGPAGRALAALDAIIEKGPKPLAR